jgi:tetratricopeptide (TPR) repeat protein
MYNLLIAILAGLVVVAIIKLAGFAIWAALLPAVVALLLVYILLARRIGKRVQALSTAAQKELSVQSANVRERQQRVDKAIKILEEGLVYERWQFLIASEIHAQIGMIKYLVKDLDGAFAHLSKAHGRNYMAKAILGAFYFQRKDYAKMESAFEAAVKTGKKESVVWAAYAWCLQQLKEKDKAFKVLQRAVAANPSDEKLKASLTALQNDKRLRMKAYEPMWWQFGLEQPPMDYSGGRRVQFVRR